MTLVDRARAALLAITPRHATPDEAAELRRLIGIVLAGSAHDEQREALAVARADPDAALECFRLLAAAKRCDKSEIRDEGSPEP